MIYTKDRLHLQAQFQHILLSELTPANDTGSPEFLNLCWPYLNQPGGVIQVGLDPCAQNCFLQHQISSQLSTSSYPKRDSQSQLYIGSLDVNKYYNYYLLTIRPTQNGPGIGSSDSRPHVAQRPDYESEDEQKLLAENATTEYCAILTLPLNSLTVDGHLKIDLQSISMIS